MYIQYSNALLFKDKTTQAEFIFKALTFKGRLHFTQQQSNQATWDCNADLTLAYTFGIKWKQEHTVLCVHLAPVFYEGTEEWPGQQDKCYF